MTSAAAIPQDWREGRRLRAWEEAGAVVGWSGLNPHGFLVFRPRHADVAGPIPAFRFSKPPVLDRLAALPAPDRPFGLRLDNSEWADDDLLRLPAVGGGETTVLPYRLRAPFARLADVRQYQIVREPRVFRKPAHYSKLVRVVREVNVWWANRVGGVDHIKVPPVRPRRERIRQRKLDERKPTAS